jgi:pimeloyl-ACP methyl ester carboxylesterase
MNSATAIHITRWGTNGPAVVMVHGSAQGSRVGGDRHFAAQKELASRGWQLIVPDRPGHGQSAAPGRPDDAILDGAWVAELLGEGAHLVGHSFGGTVALCAAGQRPEAVRSLTMIEPAILSLAIMDPHVQTFIHKQVEIFSSGRPPHELMAEFCKLVGVPESLRGGPSDTDEMSRVGQGLLEIRMPPDDKLRACAAAVARAKIPVLIVTGGWNSAFEVTAAIAATLMNGRHQVIESPHHFPHLVSDEFNKVLDTFMQAADRARSETAVR